LKLATVSIDSADAEALARWWANVLGGTVGAFPEAGFWNLTADCLDGHYLGFNQVEQPTPGKNRIHLDFSAPDSAAAAAALVAAGAELIRDNEFQGLAWVTMADPDGNLFDITDGI